MFFEWNEKRYLIVNSFSFSINIALPFTTITSTGRSIYKSVDTSFWITILINSITQPYWTILSVKSVTVDNLSYYYWRGNRFFNSVSSFRKFYTVFNTYCRSYIYYYEIVALCLNSLTASFLCDFFEHLSIWVLASDLFAHILGQKRHL